ncbi:MAG: hypothetical protein NTZ34_00100 [Chloroflexi bacterium]|nr:hypothetical protein [Chloroflexota bacterium]
MKNKINKIPATHITKYIATLLTVLVITACSSPSISTSKPNNSPTIENISYAKDSMATIDNQIVCRASDPDGDSLTYEWSTDGGQITGNGPSALWIAPGTMGNYKISVVVKDGKEGETMKSVDIRVLNNADGTSTLPITLSMRLPSSDIVSENVSVKVGTVTKVSCAIENAAGKKINYSWSATGGKMKGKGLEDQSCTTVNWTAPPNTILYTLTVIATDSDGNQTQGNVIFDVFCCPRN